MSESSTTTGVVLGASTTAAGIAVLPNTGGNALLMVFSFVTIAVGGAVLASFAISRIASKFLR